MIHVIVGNLVIVTDRGDDGADTPCRAFMSVRGEREALKFILVLFLAYYIFLSAV
jgi:hypothetical protein